MTKPSKPKKWLWVAVATIAIAILFPIKWIDKLRTNSDKQSDQTESVVDSLKIVISNYERLESIAEIELQDVRDSVDMLERQIRKDKETIANLKKKSNEDVNNVSRYTVIDINNFWADRYKDSLNTK